MNRITLIAFAVLIALVGVFGYMSYNKAQRVGELETTLELANGVNKQWQESYSTLQAELEGRQKRLDEALARDTANQQYASQQSRLFRTEIDALKRTNNELRQLLDTRIPDSLLNSLCARGYASASVCAGLLPTP